MTILRISIIRGSTTGKTNSLFHLASHQPDTDTIYLYAKDSYKVKHQFCNKR